MTLQEQFGPIDIYLFDQLLKGRIARGARIFDAGCGSGRNLVWFINEGFETYGVDSDPAAVAGLPAGNFRHEALENMSFPNAFADVVIASAVLHFARNDDHFLAMLNGAWRVLKPGGLFFCRLASSIGIEGRIVSVEGRRFQLPDGSQRYLVDEPMLLDLTRQLGGRLIDPLKTTIVQNQRSMTTWVLTKLGSQQGS
jgi:SAM-dependent methyltransferase